MIWFARVQSLGQDKLAGLVGGWIFQGFVDGLHGKKAGLFAGFVAPHSIGDDKTRKPGIDQKPVLVVGSKSLKGVRPGHPLECCQNIGPVLGEGIKGPARV